MEGKDSRGDVEVEHDSTEEKLQQVFFISKQVAKGLTLKMV